MNGGRLHRKILEWCPSGRKRRKGRPRNSWMKEVIIGMSKKGINNMESIEKVEWRIEIK